MRRVAAYVSFTLVASLVWAALFAPFPLLSLHYPVWINNDPLTAPIRVKCIDRNRLELADGRVLHVDSKDPSLLPKRIRAAGYRVDLEELPNGTILICGPVELTRCGTPWMALIRIPIFADPTPRYWRQPIAWQDADSIRAHQAPGGSALSSFLASPTR